MSIGAQIRRCRLKAGRSQRSVADEAKVAVAYLSRVENGRVTPTLRTLGRLAGALGVEISAFLDARAPLEPPDRCPVSLSGRCILDQLASTRGRRRRGAERYGPDELAALKLCNLLLQSANRQTTRMLTSIMKGLLASVPRSGK